MGALARLRGRTAIARDLMGFLWKRKLWWMLPLMGVLLLLGLIVVAAQGSALSPFIYTLF